EMVPLDEAVKADLLDDLGTAESYLGESDAARSHLAEASSLHARGERPRPAARSLCYPGIAAFRSGDPEDAARCFQRAASIAKRIGATDLWIYAAQNEAAARHQIGEPGAAHRTYEACLRVAVATGSRGAETGVRTNLARLYVDVGDFDRALRVGQDAERAALEEGSVLLSTTAAAALSNAHRFESEWSEAHEALDRALAHLGDDDEEHVRERSELALQRVELYLSEGRVEAARELLEAVAPSGDSDLEARRTCASAKVALVSDRVQAAIEAGESALHQTHEAGLRLLGAEVRQLLSRALAATGAELLALRHRDEARLIWERAAASLDESWRSVFWAHPLRRRSADTPVAAHPVRAASPAGEMSDRAIRRLIAINQKLASSLDPDQVLAWALDSAIELTGAERGFVLTGKGLDVTVMRNVDPRANEDLVFSRSIAACVLETGQPITSIDAGQDERFRGQASIHSMRRLSVMAAPIRAKAGIVGVVYLDHRFRRSRFDEGARELLVAISDQLGIALTNAQLVRELEARNLELDRLASGQRRELRRLWGEVRAQRAALAHRFDFSSIIGESAGLQRVFDTLGRVVDTDLPVLIQGESGTGKAVVARAIHYQGPRRERPLVSVNCGALSKTLLTSELFGHVKGAFIGANAARDGAFVAAKGGTLFLDEVGEMPLSMQAKLLRALQDQEVTPLGSDDPVAVDARIVAATNRKLDDEVASGAFREDLYYRLGVVVVTLPPLRARHDDIPLLAAHLLERAAERTQRARPDLSPEAVEHLVEHDWPGNVRELENVITRAVALSREGIITPDDLHLSARPPETDVAITSAQPEIPSPQQARANRDRDELRAALEAHRWNITKVAQALGVSRPTVYRKMDRYGLRD
ncbi:MAG: sigma 54-interacting transcriptional regulator, partial [Myxococcota bacterium]